MAEDNDDAVDAVAYVFAQCIFGEHSASLDGLHPLARSSCRQWARAAIAAYTASNERSNR